MEILPQALQWLRDGKAFAPAYPSPLDLELAFTRTFRLHQNSDPAVRELECLKVMFPAILQPVVAGDLLAGRIIYPLIGVSPEPCGAGYYCAVPSQPEALAALPEERRRQIAEVVEFWSTHATSHKFYQHFSPALREALPSNRWTLDRFAAFPLFRFAGMVLDYQRLLQRGLSGLRQDVHAAMAGGEPQAGALFQGMLGVIDLVAHSCGYCADQTQALAAAAPESSRRAELTAMAAALRHIASAPPRTFREAAQLFWLAALISGSWNYGRMDIYLGPFLGADLRAGRITETQALHLLESLWRLMAAYENQYNNRVFIGGRGRGDMASEADADTFALLAIEATRSVRLNQPQLSLRFYDGQAPTLMTAALAALGEGCTFPILYNDDVNISAVAKAFAVSRADAEQYTPYGCGEYVIEHRSCGTPNALLNMTKCVEAALHNGRDAQTGARVGPATGDPAGFGAFDDLWRAYAIQVEYHVTALAQVQKLSYDVVAQDMPFLLVSLLHDDCLTRGRALLSGGVRHLGGTLETYGNINASDALFAVQETVYRQKSLTLQQVIAACDADFQGSDHQRVGRLLSAVAKYGNDDEGADAMARRVHEHVCLTTRAQAPRVGLDSFLVVIINNWANVVFGQSTSATPDGRHAGQPLANGNNPTAGNDHHGATAFLNSLVKLDPTLHAGAVQNMKFARSLFVEQPQKLQALLRTYFAQGGAQAMITVVNAKDMEAAMRAPEKWEHLLVRVGGFSARFVDLSRELQLDLLQRTLHE